jgi:CheY-like chemotaxis protein
MSILYIDDDVEDREIFMEAVKKISPKLICYEASDGIEGFEILNSLMDLPDVIFLDVNMPRMNGMQFLQELQDIPDFRSIPVFMYSTSNNYTEHSDYIRMGAKKFLTKRCSFSQICDTIRGALKPNGI